MNPQMPLDPMKCFEWFVNSPKHLELTQVMADLDQEKRLELLNIAKFLLNSKDRKNLTGTNQEAMHHYEELTRILENQNN